ncbi:unnamed protein product [Amoebophrya sp. A25]|nr:unnamed protein product [Amoebophrya sp. A25]|eukprot:GSA25T00024377001.1
MLSRSSTVAPDPGTGSETSSVPDLAEGEILGSLNRTGSGTSDFIAGSLCPTSSRSTKMTAMVLDQCPDGAALLGVAGQTQAESSNAPTNHQQEEPHDLSGLFIEMNKAFMPTRRTPKRINTLSADVCSGRTADEIRLERQLGYYFSDKNLWRDEWLVARLGGESCTGWIDVDVIASFRRVRQITCCPDVVLACMRRVPGLEVRQRPTSAEDAGGLGGRAVLNNNQENQHANGGARASEVDLQGDAADTASEVSTTPLFIKEARRSPKNRRSGKNGYEVRRTKPLPAKLTLQPTMSESSVRSSPEHGATPSISSSVGSKVILSASLTAGGSHGASSALAGTRRHSKKMSEHDSDDEDARQLGSTTTLDGPLVMNHSAPLLGMGPATPGFPPCFSFGAPGNGAVPNGGGVPLPSGRLSVAGLSPRHAQRGMIGGSGPSMQLGGAGGHPPSIDFQGQQYHLPGSSSSTSASQQQLPAATPGFRQVPKTGVIYVMDEAAKHGYSAATAHQWANLGQGSPETTAPKHWPTNVRNRIKELVADGKLAHEQGPFADLKSLEVNAENLHYGNVNGDLALRKAVAKFYNDMYRKGKSSVYTAENVALVGGGRLALTRLCTAMDNINLGHFLPDYTAYTELLSHCKNINSIPIPLNPENNFRVTLQELRREIVGKGLSALLLSNPCNPTGQLVEGEELKNWVRIARETQCSLVLDEIYSRYVYTQRMAPTDAMWRMVSAAQFVEDVNKDPIIILDGLTKNWRMPGLRVCWIVGPKNVIEAVGAAGSFLDGGPSLPTQRALVPLLHPKAVVEQTVMLQLLFAHKRDFLLRRLAEMQVIVEHPPQGTFYCWCDLSQLPPPLNHCWGFFHTMLREAKVIVCPGVFFDVNPGYRRQFSNYMTFVRLSYGPSFQEIKRGLDAIEKVIRKYREIYRSQQFSYIPDQPTLLGPGH